MFREMADHFIKHIADPKFGRCRDRDRISDTEIVKLISICHKFLEAVNFVHDEDHRLFRTAEHICDTCICIYESLPYIRHKNDHICGIDRDLCLFTHL